MIILKKGYNSIKLEDEMQCLLIKIIVIVNIKLKYIEHFIINIDIINIISI